MLCGTVVFWLAALTKYRRSQIIAMSKLSSRYDCIRQYARSVQWVARGITAIPTLGESGA